MRLQTIVITDTIGIRSVENSGIPMAVASTISSNICLEILIHDDSGEDIDLVKKSKKLSKLKINYPIVSNLTVTGILTVNGTQTI